MKWWYNINDRMEIGGRSGYEYFEDDDNYLYTIAQFFPRMTVYNEVEGWQNKQFLGSGEFTLPFGNYKVSITAPADHLIAATGELQNAEEVHHLASSGSLLRARQNRLASRSSSPPKQRRSKREKTDALERQENVGVRSRERARLRVRELAQIHLGRSRAFPSATAP